MWPAFNYHKIVSSARMTLSLNRLRIPQAVFFPAGEGRDLLLLCPLVLLWSSMIGLGWIKNRFTFCEVIFAPFFEKNTEKGVSGQYSMGSSQFPVCIFILGRAVYISMYTHSIGKVGNLAFGYIVSSCNQHSHIIHTSLHIYVYETPEIYRKTHTNLSIQSFLFSSFLYSTTVLYRRTKNMKQYRLQI
jgi:hypothetical protein